MEATQRSMAAIASLIIALAVTLLRGPVASSAPVGTHYRGLRYEGVIGQTDWFTCGPAALATLLTYYYDMPTTEAEMLEAALRSDSEVEALDREEGLSMLALRHALQEKGIASQGYRVTLEALTDYYARGGLPVILHVTQPQLHYVVAVGTVENDIVLADPSLGLYALPVDALTGEKGFSGNILVPLPHEELMQIAAAKQAEVLSQYADRRTQLDALRRRL